MFGHEDKVKEIEIINKQILKEQEKIKKIEEKRQEEKMKKIKEADKVLLNLEKELQNERNEMKRLKIKREIMEKEKVFHYELNKIDQKYNELHEAENNKINSLLKKKYHTEIT